MSEGDEIDPLDVAALDEDLAVVSGVIVDMKDLDGDVLNALLAAKVGRVLLQAALVGLATAAGVAAGGAPGGVFGGAVAKGVASLTPLAVEKLSSAIEKALEKKE